MLTWTGVDSPERARTATEAATHVDRSCPVRAGSAYKNVKYVERDFRHIKADDLDPRPVFHRLAQRVEAHVLICMLACYLTWYLRQAWAPLIFTDETRWPCVR
jgi:hypothetical protein